MESFYYKFGLTLDDTLAAGIVDLDATVVVAAIVAVIAVVADSSLDLLKYFGDSLNVFHAI
ncbi:hypothetical protein C1645_833910 [Glomus cerebriforme]|uniref:Uncharacterized protein n=1 Tax=Glomus cerebriforme TaxID=658196 RepID=A0A397SAP8_9GLOM|nr:hypothetical protein C1645_833910 [Glomus cerebriforme]